ncbi:MAG: hypothetical protein JEZ06_17845 [Anaerolineaceae bacterium]|nr:hypothetical protein [Anaerolineaceae bacterium]
MEMEFSQEDLELIPMFLRLHNLISFTKLYRSVGTYETQVAPVWLEELHKKLTRKMQFFRDGFSHKKAL